jgi:SAM-dependent methyltransferase
MAPGPKVVLDVGCGTGNLARPLAPKTVRVDALDAAPAMVEAGRRLPGGDHPALRWRVGSLEDAPLDPPYALVTAGASLHWMAWDVVLPRLQGVLTPGGFAAIVDLDFSTPPWDRELRGLIPRYSTNRDYRPYDLVDELESRALFERHGERRTGAVPFSQSVDDYVESFHSRNGFSRERMGPGDADAFDEAVRRLLRSHGVGDVFTVEVSSLIRWGLPGGSS